MPQSEPGVRWLNNRGGGAPIPFVTLSPQRPEAAEQGSVPLGKGDYHFQGQMDVWEQKGKRGACGKSMNNGVTKEVPGEIDLLFPAVQGNLVAGK